MIFVCNVPGEDDKTGREFREWYDIFVQCLRRRRQNGERIEEKTTKRGENSESGMIFLCNVPGEDDKTGTEFTERIHRENSQREFTERYDHCVQCPRKKTTQLQQHSLWLDCLI